MTYIEWLIARARNEWRETGVISLSLVMEMSTAGLDVPAIEHSFEETE